MIPVCLLIAAAPLGDGVRALENLRVEEAARFLERARREGPYDFESHKLLYEKLGTAYAYLDRTKEAQDAFTRLLFLDRSHKLSPGSSPKILGPFEWARYQVSSQPETTVDIQWPTLVHEGARTIPVHLTVGADPKTLIDTLRVTLIESEGNNSVASAKAVSIGVPVRLELPVTSRSNNDEGSLQLSYVLRGLDASGNESYGVGSTESPQTIRLPYEKSSSWYSSWWFWSVVGGVAIAGGAVAAVALTRDPAESQPLSFRLP